MKKQLKKFAKKVDRYFSKYAEYHRKKLLARKPQLRSIFNNDFSEYQTKEETPNNNHVIT